MNAISNLKGVLRDSPRLVLLKPEAGAIIQQRQTVMKNKGKAGQLCAWLHSHMSLDPETCASAEILDNVAQSVVVLSCNGRVTFCNRAFCEMTKRKLDNIISTSFSDFIAAPEAHAFASFLKRAERERASARFHFDLGGDTFIAAKITATPAAVQGGSALVLSIVDLRECLLREQKIREEEARLQILAMRTHDIMYSLNSDGIIEYMGPQVKRYGYSAAELTGQNFWQLIIPEDHERMAEALQKALDSSGEMSVDFRIEDKNGNMHWLENRGTVRSPLHNDQYCHIVGILRDVTAAKIAARERLEKQHKLRLLASQLSLAEAKERRNLALLLHDTIGLNLALCKIKIGELRSLVEKPKLVAVLEAIRNLIGHSLESIRATTNELSPPLLYEVGLEAALEMLVEDLNAKTKIDITFADDGRPKPVTDDFRVVLYQAARELIMNATRHAEADKIQVRMRRVKTGITITVSDNGKGFDAASSIVADQKSDNFGLFSIHERLEYLGGKLEVRSTPGEGASIRLTAPLRTG